MNALEHYREAERLLDVASTAEDDHETVAELIALAQVHATLALVGPILMERAAPYSDDNAALYGLAVLGR